MLITDITLDRGGTYILRFPLTSPPNEHLGAVTTWTTRFEVRTTKFSNTTPVLVCNGAISTEVLRANVIGVFDATITANQTTALTKNTYYWRYMRTDPGFEDVLGKGQLNIEG